MSKVCSKCKLDKPLDEFYKSKKGTYGVQGYCKKCSRQKRNDWYHKNAQEINRKEYERRKNDPLYQAYVDNWRELNREHIREQCRQYYYDNSEKWRIYNRTRKARVRGADGGFTLDQWLELCELCGFICVSCQELVKLTVDHINPVSLGGSNYIENIQPLCGSCNSRKKDKYIDYRPTKVKEFYSGVRPKDS